MAANDKEVLVKADHVKVYFKGKKRGQTVKAVDDVSFEIMKGETFGVVGESGCGKSTLGRTLIRLQQPTDGHIYLNGTDIAGLKGAQLKEMRKEAQIIFQDPSACLNPRIKCTLCQGHYDFSFSDFYFIFVCCVEASK